MHQDPFLGPSVAPLLGFIPSSVLASDSEPLSFFSSSSLPRKNLMPATRICTGKEAVLFSGGVTKLFNRIYKGPTSSMIPTLVTLEKHAVVITLTVLASFL